MKIAFLLPNYSGNVVGSVLVYYRFAQDLVARGHSVDIFHPAIVEDHTTIRQELRALAWSGAKTLSTKPVPWMDFPKGATPKFRPRLEGLRLEHDRVVAFSWRMVEALATMKTRGPCFGYIVEYETWAEADPIKKSRMERAYLADIPLLCSSYAVESMLKTVGAKDPRLCVHGVDVGPYSCRIAPADRQPIRIGFPVRSDPVKSPEVLAECVRQLKIRHGNQVVLWGFGTGGQNPELIDRFDEFHISPSNLELAQLYNRSSIFAVASRKEGFGMPAAEAMACGCAVVSTDNGGIRTFGQDGVNCLLVPPEDPTELANAISRLVTDETLRLELAGRAPHSIEFLGWKPAGDRFAAEVIQ